MSTNDFFRSRLNQLIDLHHPLAVLATRLALGGDRGGGGVEVGPPSAARQAGFLGRSGGRV